jgi:hypothetical protein
MIWNAGRLENPPLLMLIVLSMLGAVMFGILLSLSPILGVAIAMGVGAILLVMIIASHPLLGVCFVMVSFILSGYSLEVSSQGFLLASYTETVTTLGISIRLEYALVPLSLIGVLLHIITRRLPVIVGHSPLLGLWIGTNLTSSLIYSPDLIYSLRMCYFYVVGFCAYLLIINVARNIQCHKRILKIYFFTAIAAALFAISPWGGRWSGGGLIRLHGSFLEPTVFGGYGALVSLTMLAWAVWRRRSRVGSRWDMLFVGLVMGVTILSFTRAAWIGLALGCCVIWWCLPERRSRPATFAMVLVIFALSILFIQFLWVSDAYVSLPVEVAMESPIYSRITDDTLVSRLEIMRAAIDDTLSSFLFGKGTLTFGLSHSLPFLQTSSQLGWITSGFLLVFHDTGIFGLVIFMMFVVLLIRDVLRAKKDSNLYVAHTSVGALAGIVAWLFMDQFTTMLTIPFTWAYLGLASSLVFLDGNNAPQDRCGRGHGK